MALNSSPQRPLWNLPFVELQGGDLTPSGLNVINQMWKQIAAGFVIVPCTATGTNLIILTPRLNVEGGQLYGDGMTWVAPAAAASTGAVTAKVTTLQYGDLATIKVFKSPGTTQANNGDIAINGVYFFTYYSFLDSGNGGFVAK